MANQIRIAKLIPSIKEVKKIRPDLALLDDLEASKILLQERISEILTNNFKLTTQNQQGNSNNKEKNAFGQD